MQLEATVSTRPVEQWTGSKLGKEYVKVVYCHPPTSCEMLDWMNHKLESRLLGEIINNLRYADDTTLIAESKEELKNLLKKVKEKSKKPGLKFNIQKLRSWHLIPSLHGK